MESKVQEQLQSYILSTTTETLPIESEWIDFLCFNRTSFQQQLKLDFFTPWPVIDWASIVHPFNNNWNSECETPLVAANQASIVHPFNNNWNCLPAWFLSPLAGFNRTSFQQQLKLFKVLDSSAVRSFNRTSFQQQLKHGSRTALLAFIAASIVHPFNNNWNSFQKKGKFRPWPNSA